MFQVTSAAAHQIRVAAFQSDASALALRIAARQVSDGSIEYGMGFDTTRESDEPHVFDGVTVVVAAGCQPLLEATVLDWVELDPGTFSFIFIPPTIDPGDSSPAPGRSCGGGGCGNCGTNSQY